MAIACGIIFEIIMILVYLLLFITDFWQKLSPYLAGIISSLTVFAYVQDHRTHKMAHPVICVIILTAVVLILAGADPAALAEQDHRSWDTVPLEEHMEIYLSKGMTRKEAMKKVAADRGLSRRDIYRALLQEENG